jgi:uncharacterized protein (DUF302 family)
MIRVRILAFLIVALIVQTANADNLLMVRSSRPFPEAMADLQRVVAAHGYQITRFQRVDVGLASSGFKTAEYRLVFFGKTEEMEKLPAIQPELMAYLPLKVVVFAEGETTLLLIDDPALLAQFFPAPALRPYFERWKKDVRAILDEVAHATD